MTDTPLAQAGRRIRIGNLWIDALTFSQAVDAIEALVTRRQGGTVLTPNVDHVVNAQRDARLLAAYEHASLSLADGQPVVWASHLLGTPLPAKISGSDLLEPLLKRAAERRFRVFLLGGGPGVAEQAAARIAQSTGAEIVGAEGPMVGVDERADEAALVERIQRARPHLLFVALGSPKQELFMHRAAARLVPAVCLGVGASLDFIAGTVKRAPSWMSDAGLEWLFRLAQEPRRLARRYLLNDPQFVAIVWRALWTPRSAREKGAGGNMNNEERRQYPRLKAPVFCRPSGLRVAGVGETVDIGRGGARVYADEKAEKGNTLELELLLPDGSAIVCKAVVAWSVPLPPGSPASFDVGLQFLELSDDDRERLTSVLDESA